MLDYDDIETSLALKFLNFQSEADLRYWGDSSDSNRFCELKKLLSEYRQILEKKDV